MDMTSFLEVFARPENAVVDDQAVEAGNRLRAEAQDKPAKAKERAVTTLADGRKEIDNLDGSHVTTNAQGLVQKLTRANGSVVECEYNGNLLNKIKEIRNGKTIEWNRDATEDRWRSMEYVGAQRINFRVNDLGQTSFEDVMGTSYTTHGDGKQTRRKSDGSTIEIDEKWQVTSVTRRDGSKLECSFQNGSLSRVTERNGNSVVDWHYDAKKDEWTSPQSKDVRKSVSVSDLGNYAYISAKGSDVVNIEYADGNRREFEYDAGRVSKVTEHMPSGKIVWQRDAATDNFVNGSTKEVRKHLTVSLNGEYSFVDAAGYKHLYRYDTTEDTILPTDLARTKKVQEARDDLLKAATAAIPQKDIKPFTRDLDTFEQRAHSAGLTEAQVVAALNEVQKILVSTVQKPVLNADRVKLAEETLAHIANPRSIDQGVHDTCGAASAQVFVAQLYPEKFAALIREVADTGSFKMTNGQTVTPEKNSILPDWEAKSFNVYNADAWGRSYAGQVYQVVGINAAYQALGSQWEYRQGRPQNPKDTGERLINKNDGSVAWFAGLYDHEVVQITKQTAGKEIAVLRYGTSFNTVADLQKQVRDLQKQNRLPAVLPVYVKNEPFWTATGRGRGGGAPGAHYVTLWDIDSAGRTLVDNQWGRRGDYESLRRLPLQQVFDATKP